MGHRLPKCQAEPAVVQQPHPEPGFEARDLWLTDDLGMLSTSAALVKPCSTIR